MFRAVPPNPDRIPVSVRRRKCESVEAMRRQGWDVIAKCQTCGVMLRVNLSHIARLQGPTFSLWNRKSRCKRVGCHGWTQFLGRAPGMGWHEPLEAPNPPEM